MPKNKLKWDFEKQIILDSIVAIRVRFIDLNHPDEENLVILRIPEGGKCEYIPKDRIFQIYGQDGEIFRKLHAPDGAAIDISYIEKEYLNMLDQANSESYKDDLN
jgi:hypothetical protein